MEMKGVPEKPLSPTLWRTCRILSGRTRISLLRRILTESELSVSQHAEAEGISVPRASQELRRLQSRGIIGVKRKGRRVEYVPDPDPLVKTGAPILGALKKTFLRLPSSEDEQICCLADGLGHEKRIGILRCLRSEPLPLNRLAERSGYPESLLFHHLRILKRDGWVSQRDGVWQMKTNREVPLADCLLKLM